MTSNCTVFTIGHSTHSVAKLTELLMEHGVTAVADVRSKPYSRVNPHFNKDDLERSLRAFGLAYVFIGHQLGGRPADRRSYVDGKLQYDRLARTREFSVGLNRVIKGARNERIALMCAEKDPLKCHRAILISRHLAERAISVEHIMEDGRLERHADSESRLLIEVGIGQPELFRSRVERIAEAYQRRGQQIAYSDRGEDTGIAAVRRAK